ncbi:hypothetical protein [Kitasatospora sp. NPDC058218]|uniref:hypothetical protein n=1 Tax=Kitasatospora sp. NPDC058218 TaxID=3346385 RepID=UPI0036DE9495
MRPQLGLLGPLLYSATVIGSGLAALAVGYPLRHGPLLPWLLVVGLVFGAGSIGVLPASAGWLRRTDLAASEKAGQGADTLPESSLPAGHLWKLGRCVSCFGKLTLVAPGLYYLREDGEYVNILSCAEHHRRFIRTVHQAAMKATLAPYGEGVE